MIAPDKPAAKTQSGHKVLTAQQKKELCTLKEQCCKLTQAQLIEHAEKAFGIRPSMSQINRMLQSKAEHLNIREVDGSRKRNRGAKWPLLEEAVDVWYRQMKQHDMAVADCKISAKAREIADMLGIRPFSGSGGWLSNFKHRQGIHSNTMSKPNNPTNALSCVAQMISSSDHSQDGLPKVSKRKADTALVSAGEPVQARKNQKTQELPPHRSSDVGLLGIALGIPAPAVYGRIEDAQQLDTSSYLHLPDQPGAYGISTYPMTALIGHQEVIGLGAGATAPQLQAFQLQSANDVTDPTNSPFTNQQLDQRPPL